MGVLTENELNEFAASMLDPKTGAPGVVDPNTAYDWVHNAEMVIEKNAIEMGENASPDALRKYVKNEIRKKILDLGRFSPGEMSIFYVNDKEGMHPSQVSTQDVFAQKFGLDSPSEIAGGLKRTMMFGDVVREQFTRLFSDRGFQTTSQSKKNISVLRNKLMDLYNNPLPNLPWLKPGRVELMEDVTGEKWAVFFKIPPNEDSIKALIKETPEHYYAEFAQTLIAMEEVGISVDRVVFAPFNIAEMKFGMTEGKKSKYPQFKSSIKEVTVSEELKQDIKRLGNELYNNYLLKVDMPPWKISGNFENIEAHTLEASTKKQFGEYSFYNAIKNLADKKAEGIKKGMLKLAPTKLGIPPDAEGKFRAGGYIDFNQKEKQKFNSKGAAAFLMDEHEIDIKDLVKEVLDDGKIQAVFANLGLQEDMEERFVTTEYSTTVTIPRNSEYKATADDLAAEALEESEGLFRQMCGLDAEDDADLKISRSETINVDKVNEAVENSKKGQSAERDSTADFGL